MSKHPDRRWIWHSQITACAKRGYDAWATDGKKAKNPYEPANGAGTIHGVQGQRRAAWNRGYERAKAGKPFDDQNG